MSRAIAHALARLVAAALCTIASSCQPPPNTPYACSCPRCACADFSAGDIIEITFKHREGSGVSAPSKYERKFKGLVLGRKDRGASAGGPRGLGSSVHVRNVIADVGVEFVYPLHSKNITRIEVRHACEQQLPQMSCRRRTLTLALPMCRADGREGVHSQQQEEGAKKQDLLCARQGRSSS